MTPITEEYLIQKGFEKVVNAYRLKLETIWKGERQLLANPLPHNRWSCVYMIEGLYASKIKDYTEEVDMLIEVLK